MEDDMKLIGKLFFFCLVIFLLCPKVSDATDTFNKYTNQYYKIGKGDELEINVWKEKDLTRIVKVRTDGRISLPLIDDIKAEGMTPDELKTKIERKLSRFITKPFITVMVTKENNKFYMIGEINKIGEYDLTKDLTILQAIALAGGFTEWANKDDIVLLRYENGVEKRFKISYKKIISGKKQKENYFIKRNDTIIVK